MGSLLLDKMKANRPKTVDTPATDAQARPVIEAADGDVQTFNGVNADGFIISPRMSGPYPDLDVMPTGWTIKLTDQRILFHHPMSCGFFGKPKLKAGTSTCGEIYYSWINNVEMNFEKKTENYNLYFSILRKGDEPSLNFQEVISIGQNKQNFMPLAKAFYEKYQSFLQSNGYSDSPAHQQVKELLSDDAVLEESFHKTVRLKLMEELGVKLTQAG
jgi:hypothetical protein